MNRKKLDKKVLAEGEATGHAHRVDVDVYELPSGVREFDGSATVTHEEHKSLRLNADKWASAKVLEYDHFAEEARNVVD